ncbi:hypothetical protein Ana3638_20530 [Anaerocolumna sedimenticola]|uniref:Uncharacterized protein n=1 Tax=Anaerocolumna sedimenticola TaxID=2696063 RepID=A0A6P1TNQ2_9FIRM|nr:hypothetical protein [Anaerocolumna sedimenticola]QHQ62870.1 hypothetical protein Ana3638_20530 [Anaerocolumna sedimenticola]
MKLTNLAIIFFFIALTLITILDVRMNNLTAVTNKKMEYNKALDSAIDDGSSNLVEVDSKRNLVLNKEAAVNQFYESLYANLGVIGNERLENNLKGYIPIILVTDTDGFYIYYTNTYQTNGEILLGQKWSEKMPYALENNGIIYNFTLGTYLTLYDKSTNEVYTGEYEDLKAQFPYSLLADRNTFDTVRRNAIIGAIEKSMNYYINQRNEIAYQSGITYQFWLPQIDKTDWYRTIDDISILVIFQGYPYIAAGLDTYNRYALSGARIKKSNIYFITAGNGTKYYHKSACPHKTNPGIAYYSREECALEGAYPCPDCNP